MFYHAKGHGTHRAEYRQQKQLIVHRQFDGVKECGGRCNRLEESEYGEGRGRVVPVKASEDGEDLSVEAGVADAQQQGAEHGQVQVGRDNRLPRGQLKNR